MKSILTIPLYIAALTLHQVTARVDDKLIIYRYNSSNVASRSKPGSYVSFFRTLIATYRTLT